MMTERSMMRYAIIAVVVSSAFLAYLQYRRVVRE